MRKMFYIVFVTFAVFSMGALSPLTTHSASAQSTGCLPGVLKQRLSQIRQKFGSVSVISTHRRGARIAGSGRRSMHASCRAVDFHPPRGQHGKVVAWLKQNHSGGVGTYSCGMSHIHIDNGPHVRFHHCVSASGRPVRRYASGGRSNKRASRVANSSAQARRGQMARRLPSARPSTPPTSIAAGDSKNFGAQRYFSGNKINGG